jgi:hypothetical protein
MTRKIGLCFGRGAGDPVSIPATAPLITAVAGQTAQVQVEFAVGIPAGGG